MEVICMKTFNLLRRSLWIMVPFLEGEKALPLRHVACLLYILEKGETSSPEMQEVFKAGQGAVSQIIGKLAALDLVVRYPGTGANARRGMVAPSEKAHALGKALAELVKSNTKEVTT
jgi:DNA-binding MarR family transcriptional regulator